MAGTDAKSALDALVSTNQEHTLVDMDLSKGGLVKAPKNGTIALIDADTVVFGSCTSNQEITELLPREFYTDEEWEQITSSAGYNEQDQTLITLNVQTAYKSTLDKLQGILDVSGCEDWELHFTVGRSSFRYSQVKEDYKANRIGQPAPQGLYQLKRLLQEEYPDKVFLHIDFEADDAVIAKKRTLPDKYTLCAVDKDVLYSLPGSHFNYYSRPAGVSKTGTNLSEILMHYIEVSPETALKHHYIQTLTGDAGDNVIGLARVGKVTAEKMLSGLTTHRELWDRVVQEYEARGRDVIDAITNMRLVSMHQVIYNPTTDEYHLDLWDPRKLEALDKEREITYGK